MSCHSQDLPLRPGLSPRAKLEAFRLVGMLAQRFLVSSRACPRWSWRIASSIQSHGLGSGERSTYFEGRQWWSYFEIMHLSECRVTILHFLNTFDFFLMLRGFFFGDEFDLGRFRDVDLKHVEAPHFIPDGLRHPYVAIWDAPLTTLFSLLSLSGWVGASFIVAVFHVSFLCHSIIFIILIRYIRQVLSMRQSLHLCPLVLFSI